MEFWRDVMPTAVWPDLAKFCHFGKTLQVKFLKVYFLFGKVLSLLWQIWYIIGLNLIVGNGQILKNNLTIWSHWPAGKILVIFYWNWWQRFEMGRGGGQVGSGLAFYSDSARLNHTDA